MRQKHEAEWFLKCQLWFILEAAFQKVQST